MSFSNADTGDKPADPYKATNLDTSDLKTKVEELSKFIDSCKFGMMTTRIESSGLLTSRCMAVAAKVILSHSASTVNPPVQDDIAVVLYLKEADDVSNQQEGHGIDLIFHTNTESGKTDDLESDPKINIAFLNATGEWASISGEAKIITDREMVRKYYSPALKAWLGDLEDGKHDGGPEDPRIGCIKVFARTATYAIAEGTFMGRGLDIAKGAITGQSPKVNKLREISEEELTQWR